MVYAVANERSRLEIPEGPLGKLISGNYICGYRQTEIVLIFFYQLCMSPKTHALLAIIGFEE